MRRQNPSLCPACRCWQHERPERRLTSSAHLAARSGQLGYTHKTYGPYCAYEGWHNFTYTSDANPDETTWTITDSYGLIKASGDMYSFPITFHTLLPSKFCTPEGGLDEDQMKKRNRKLFAYHDQFKPRAQLLQEGWSVPQDQDPPLSTYNNSGGSYASTYDLRNTP